MKERTLNTIKKDLVVHVWQQSPTWEYAEEALRQFNDPELLYFLVKLRDCMEPSK